MVQTQGLENIFVFTDPKSPWAFCLQWSNSWPVLVADCTMWYSKNAFPNWIWWPKQKPLFFFSFLWGVSRIKNSTPGLSLDIPFGNEDNLLTKKPLTTCKRGGKNSALNTNTIRSLSDMYSNRGMTQTRKCRDPHCSGVLHLFCWPWGTSQRRVFLTSKSGPRSPIKIRNISLSKGRTIQNTCIYKPLEKSVSYSLNVAKTTCIFLYEQI